MGLIGTGGGEGEVRIGHSELSYSTSCEPRLLSVSSVGDIKACLLMKLTISVFPIKHLVGNNKPGFTGSILGVILSLGG